MATSPLLVLDANGSPRTEPSVSSRWSFDETTASRFIAQRDVVMLSYMEGGPANELVPYIDLQLLQTTYDPENLSILGSNLASYLKTPSFDPNVRGAYRIYVIRIGQPTASSLTLLDAASAPVLVLTSTDEGSYTNKISVQVSSGSIAGKRLTIRFRQEMTILDNLQNAFHLAYTGNAGTATMTMTRTGGSAVRLQTTLTGATDGSIALDLDLTLDTFSTLQALATYLNGQNGYRATIDPFGNALMPTSELDAVAGANIRTPIAFTIRYIGAGTAATMSLASGTLTTNVTGAAAENLTISFSASTTQTLGQVVAYINSQTGKYTCALGPNADPETFCLGLFPIVTNQDIRTATYSQAAQAGFMDYVATAALGSIVFAVNTRVARLSAARVTNAVNPPANVAQTFLTGGTNPSPTTADWLAALATIEREDLFGAIMLPVTTNPVLQDAVLAWAIAMHTNNGKQFRPFLAAPDFTTASQAKDMALGFNSKYAAMLFQPVVATSGLTEQEPLYPVAMYAGGAAGALPTQPITRMTLRCRRLPDRGKFSKAIREDLLSNGVCVLEEAKGVGVRISLAITTSLSQDRIDRILSETMAVDVIETRVRAYVEPLIPHWALLDWMPTVKGQVWNALASLEADGVITKGIDENGRILPAWGPIQVSIQAGIMKIVLHVLIGGEVDHILIIGTVGYQRFELDIPAGA